MYNPEKRKNQKEALRLSDSLYLDGLFAYLPILVNWAKNKLTQSLFVIYNKFFFIKVVNIYLVNRFVKKK